MKPRSRLALGLLLLGLLLVPPNIFSSGGWIEATFILQHQPDDPLKAFDGGKLGILRPKFDRRYLVIAYRYLEQRPLTAQERHSLGDDAVPQVTPPGTPYDPDPPVTAWLKTRSHVLGLKEVQKIDIQRYRRNGFAEYPNCGGDAFTNASATAMSRAQTFGIASGLMRDWVAGQDAVFQNCGSPADLQYYGPNEKRPVATLNLPPPATLDDVLLKLDRQYQVAAANFYTGNLDTAASDFEEIAREADSPWRKLAPYLVARCYIRKATLGLKDESAFLPEPMQTAEQRLQAILADKSLASMHPAAKKLLDYVEARLHPEQRLHAIAAQLASGAGENFGNDLFDYTFLLDHILDPVWDAQVQQAVQAHPGQPVEVSKLREDLPANQWRADANNSRSFDDLTDWVLTFQLDDTQTRQYRLDRWQATKSTPWLLSALVTMRAGDTHTDELMSAAATIAADSPAYETALYQRVRLLEEESKSEQARTLLDTNWAHIEKASPSNRNAFTAQRFAVATSFQEFLRFAPRTLVEADYGNYYCTNGTCRAQNSSVIEPPPELDLDSVEIFNLRLPLSLLVQAANGNTLPANLRDQLAARTWLRAAILDDTAAVHELEPHVIGKFPQMRSYIEQYDRADSAQARRFALVFMVMQFPEHGALR